MKYEILVDNILHTHQHFQHQAAKAVNVSLTLRNWLIGFYIVEFEQKGEERATYGQNLIKILSESLAIKGFGETNLKLFRQFYMVYPEVKAVLASHSNILPFPIRQSLTDESLSEAHQIGQLSTDELQYADYKSIKARKLSSEESISQLNSEENRNYFLILWNELFYKIKIKIWIK